jgi:ornithine cyclodeaminase/alanine dehydrogenase-like protein (mu-crystallin family)
VKTPLWIDEDQVRAALPMSGLIVLMGGTLRAFSAGAVEQPVRAVIEAAPNAFFASMPCFIKGGIPLAPAMGTKVVTVFGANAAKGLPTHLATILLMDPGTGELLAVMDGRYITEARTAAVSAASTHLLARKDAGILALIGSGVQARSHLEALTMVRKFREIRCWSPTRANLERFIAEHPDVRAASSAREAVDGADVVALLTASTTPVVQNDWVSNGAHIVAVGACRPTHREMDPHLVGRARLFVDSRAAALKEAGDILLGIAEGHFTADHIEAELGNIDSTLQRSDSEVTVFKSLGLAAEDVAAARYVFSLLSP